MGYGIHAQAVSEVKRQNLHSRFKISVKYSVFLLLLCAVLLTCSAGGCGEPAGTDSPEKKYGIFIGAEPGQNQPFSDYSIIVIDAAYFSKSDIDRFHEEGLKVYSYLNIGSLEDFRGYFEDYRHLALGEYNYWPGEYWADVSSEEWQNLVYKQAELLVSKGIDGFFADNADVYFQFRNKQIYDGLITIFVQLSRYNKDIIINGADVFVTEALLENDHPEIKITGISQECVFTDIDFENMQPVLQSAENKEYYQMYIAKCRIKGLQVCLIEYCTDEELIHEIKQFCTLSGCSCYISPSAELK